MSSQRREIRSSLAALQIRMFCRTTTPIVQRHEIIEMMRELKVSGMGAACDDVMRAALQHKRSGAEIVGDLLKSGNK